MADECPVVIEIDAVDAIKDDGALLSATATTTDETIEQITDEPPVHLKLSREEILQLNIESITNEIESKYLQIREVKRKATINVRNAIKDAIEAAEKERIELERIAKEEAANNPVAADSIDDGDKDDDDEEDEDDGDDDKEIDVADKSTKIEKVENVEELPETIAFNEEDQLIINELEKELSLLHSKYKDKTQSVFDYSDIFKVKTFIENLYYELQLDSRTAVTLLQFYDNNSYGTFSSNTISKKIKGRNNICKSIIDMYHKLSVKQSIVSIVIDKEPPERCNMYATCYSLLAVEDDEPRKIREIFEFKQLETSSLDIVITNHIFMNQSNRPLYVYSDVSVEKTAYDNREDHLKTPRPMTPISTSPAIVMDGSTTAATIPDSGEADNDNAVEEKGDEVNAISGLDVSIDDDDVTEDADIKNPDDDDQNDD